MKKDDNLNISELNKSLELTIMPTEQCDFRCTYCYEEFKLKEMSSDTVKAVKSLITKRVPDISYLNISWFGGEPLVAYKQVVDVMEHANSSKLELNPNLSLTSEMTTNGYKLTEDKLRKLVKLGVKQYQISFDGDKDEHDKLRVKRDGKPTFDVIWKNVTNAKLIDMDFIMLLRLHVNSDNEPSSTRFLDRVKSEIGKDSRYTLYIRKLSRLGGKNDTSLPILAEDSKSVERLIDTAHKLGLKTMDIGREYVCYAAKPNAYVIRSDGSLSKCTVNLYDGHNKVGRLLRDGSLEVEKDKVLLWSRGIFSGDKEELGCPMKNFPLDQLLKQNNKLKILQ